MPTTSPSISPPRRTSGHDASVGRLDTASQATRQLRKRTTLRPDAPPIEIDPYVLSMLQAAVNDSPNDTSRFIPTEPLSSEPTPEAETPSYPSSAISASFARDEEQQYLLRISELVDYALTITLEPDGLNDLDGHFSTSPRQVPQSPVLPSTTLTPMCQASTNGNSRTPTRRSSTLSRSIQDATKYGEPLKAVVLTGLKCFLKQSWPLNALIFSLPVAWAMHFARKEESTTLHNSLIFGFSFVAIISLAAMIAYATEQLAVCCGQASAGLINAALGNIVELTFSIFSLIKCDLEIVKSLLVGAFVGRILFLLGMCFLCGGIRYRKQRLGSRTAVSMSIVLLIVIGITTCIPAIYPSAGSPRNSESTQSQENKTTLTISRAMAPVLLVIYAGYIYFQLFSYRRHPRHSRSPTSKSHRQLPENAEDKAEKGDVRVKATGHPKLPWWMSLPLLVVLFVCVGITSESLDKSLEGLTTGNPSKIPKDFIGLVILPFVGNAAEHFTEVSAAMRGKTILSVNVAVGSSIQIALVVAPCLVILAWILGKPLTFVVAPTHGVMLFASSLVVVFVISDRKSNWLKGLILVGVYILIALLLWFYHGDEVSHPAAFCGH